jgi:glutamyl-tRNA synthetase
MAEDNKQLKKFSRAELVDILQAATTALESSEFDAASVQETLNQLLETTGQKPGILFSMIRLAVSWAPFSPALNDTLAALGKQTTIDRLQLAIKTASAA